MKDTRKIAMTGMLAAIATVLMYLEFSVPLVPSFLKFDFSELPALIGSFSMGPLYGVLICLVKNLLKLPSTGTGGVGELANFTLGAIFVCIAGFIYKRKKNRKNALIGALVGGVAMAVLSVPINYYMTYPVYTKFMPIEAIVGMYQAINPKVNGLLSCLIMFNVPFTFVKAMLCTLITMLIYKRISPLIKGNAIR
ncbi:MAG: ECF transporter S component [Eubacteriales bacterium]|nr:ECF transporter S component [Eubacteriales bacterium]